MGSCASTRLRFLETREVQAGAKLLGLVRDTRSHDVKGTKVSRERGEQGRVPVLASAECIQRRFRCLFWESPLPLARPGRGRDGDAWEGTGRGCTVLLLGSLVQSAGGCSVLTVAFSSLSSDRNC